MAIPLRGLRVSAIQGRKRRDVHESRWTTGSRSFPLARAFLKQTARALDSELSRAKIVCLPPGHRVYPHVDRGEYYRLRNRYHLVLSSTGSWMRAGDEEVRMQRGELWWFDNDQVHEASNDGDSDRIHLIFDLLPRDRLSEIVAAVTVAGQPPSPSLPS
jgi:aspartyl/asparaginyl beta-hydroxylase (cupin superfamily)